MPSGVSIYNEVKQEETAVLSEQCEFVVLDGKNHEILRYAKKEELLKMVEDIEEPAVFHLLIEDGKVIKIQEQYLPK